MSSSLEFGGPAVMLGIAMRLHGAGMGGFAEDLPLRQRLISDVYSSLSVSASRRFTGFNADFGIDFKMTLRPSTSDTPNSSLHFPTNALFLPLPVDWYLLVCHRI